MDTRQEHNMIHTKMPGKELPLPSWTSKYNFGTVQNSTGWHSVWLVGVSYLNDLVTHVMMAILVKYLVSDLPNLIITFLKGHVSICHTTFIYFRCG